MKKIKNTINIVAFKYIYFSILLLLIIIKFLDYKYNVFGMFLSDKSNISSLAEISSTFIGFLLTIGTIYFALPTENRFKKWFIKYGHNKIFVRIILFGIIFYMMPIVSWICNTNTLDYIGLYSFVAGCFEVLAAVYYLYYLISKTTL